MRKALTAAAFLLALSCSTAYASDPESCEQTCPQGQVLISFADGNTRRCVCREEGGALPQVEEQNIACTDADDNGTCE